MIEIGEYVRTKNGIIDKIVKIEYLGYIDDYGEKQSDKYYILKNKQCFKLKEAKIHLKKHSKNIIDLIEDGDIVVYQIKGLEHSTYIDIVREYKDIRTLKNKLRIANYSLEQINIKQILTKEQFNQNCYEVEEN